ncbi:hypothetical protein [Segetibacter aerophilus]|uniref:Uncharacterized protein n=1 Tax=Segetibacter aerophilus TaxID=670293 RepID=A0A512BGS5_9BACT|nr:hypothetical protein [Segetibacter aerophilus]GEO11166.1 hypothetical protein SAE01_36620 [Segetibacter aerophilus]
MLADKAEKLGYSYSGPPIPFDASGVHPLYPHTKLADLPAATEAYRAAKLFSQSHSNLLNALDKTFNGYPDYIGYTLGLMYDVKLYGDKLAAMPFPGKDGYTIGPSFEFVNINE